MDKNREIRLIATDLDGTLLNDEKKLSSQTLAALAAAAKKGIHIVPITGRPFYGVPECVSTLCEIEYLITSNGAQIHDIKSGKTLYSFTIDNAKCRRIIGELRGIECMFEPFADGFGYSEKDVFDYYTKTFKGTVLEEYFDSSRRVCDNYEALFEDENRAADEFFVHCSSPEIVQTVTDVAERLGDLQCCLLGDRFVEITRVGTDKGEALKRICEHLGIDINNTIAFGDGDNDLSFIKAAGISVAMENAYPKIKANADIIAKSNNENGVAEIIQQII